MNSCETCTHWQSPPDPWNYTNICRDRDKDLEPTGPEYVKECQNGKLLFYERPQPDGACVVDGSQYAAKLLTGPKFGCVNWEGR